MSNFNNKNTRMMSLTGFDMMGTLQKLVKYPVNF